MLGHQTSLGKVKTEIMSGICSDHNAVRLEINYKENSKNKTKQKKNTNMWRLNNKLLNISWSLKKTKRMSKIQETNENENTVIQYLWGSAKAVLRGKSIVIQAYLRKQEKSQRNNLTLHLKEPE